MNWSTIKKGDTITFTAVHFRSGKKEATRKVLEVNTLGIGVRMFGWNPFFLDPRFDKITKVVKAPKIKK